MTNRYRGQQIFTPKRGGAVGEARDVAKALFELNESRLMAGLDAFIQEQMVRPIPALSPLVSPSSSSVVVVAAVEVTDAITVLEVAVPLQGRANPADNHQPEQRQHFSISSRESFRAWQAEIFADTEIQEGHFTGTDSGVIIENYLSRVIEGRP